MRCKMPFGYFGLPFQENHFLKKFSIWEDQTRLPFTFQPKFPDFLVTLTSKQPVCQVLIFINLFLPRACMYSNNVIH